MLLILVSGDDIILLFCRSDLQFADRHEAYKSQVVV